MNHEDGYIDGDGNNDDDNGDDVGGSDNYDGDDGDDHDDDDNYKDGNANLMSYGVSVSVVFKHDYFVSIILYFWCTEYN